MQPKVFSFSSADQVAQALDTFLEKASAEAIRRSGRFTVAFSGGSLPATVAKYLKDNKNVDFSKWFVFFSDERCVEHTDSESNYKLVKDELLSHVPIPSAQVVKISEALVNDSKKAAEDYELQMLKALGCDVVNQPPAFDCILLGIGPDGHTCSLFPGFSQVEVKDKWVTSIDDSPKPPPSRITLTLPVLNHAKNVAFVVTGGSKCDVVKRIVDDCDQSLPAARVAPLVGSLYWFLDDATSKSLIANKPADFKL
ncbi:suppressor of los1-1 [Coemansia aciculifera]|uniref:Suppressor of los1-1 n=1 Tax=Coemansia aciculifera TaxID=417176 RepID=A0ACC1M677_9FUNG|nr:suppressor of los1-1 [Coemansia aciculifera]